MVPKQPNGIVSGSRPVVLTITPIPPPDGATTAPNCELRRVMVLDGNNAGVKL